MNASQSVRILTVLLAALLALPATGQPIRIATIDGPPWGFVGPDGKPTGMMFEIGNRIAEDAGLSYRNALVPYARTAHDIEMGKADLVLRFSNEQIVRAGIPLATIVAMPVIVVGPAGTSFSNLNALQGKTVGVIRTSSYVKSFDENEAINKYAVSDYVLMTKMVAARRLDAGIGSSAGFYYGAYMAGIKPEQLGPPLVLGQNEFILFYSKRTMKPEIVKALQESVKRLIQSGEIRQIVAKYTKAYEAESPLIKQ